MKRVVKYNKNPEIQGSVKTYEDSTNLFSPQNYIEKLG